MSDRVYFVAILAVFGIFMYYATPMLAGLYYEELIEPHVLETIGEVVKDARV